MGKRSWDELAEAMGPQTAAYMHGPDWDGMLRSVQCECGAVYEILADEPVGDGLCQECAFARALRFDDTARTALGAHGEGE